MDDLFLHPLAGKTKSDDIPADAQVHCYEVLTAAPILIVVRDHAGMGNSYATDDVRKLFDEFTPGERGFQPLKYENAFYSKVTGPMATAKTAPGGPETQVNLSGANVREMLSQGPLPPPEFSRPEITQILIASMKK